MKTFVKSSYLVLAASFVLSACGGNASVANNTRSSQLASTSESLAVQGAEYYTVVQQLYIAYFGRPADPAGLSNFAVTLRNAGAPTNIQGLTAAYNTNATIKGLIDSFGISAESNRLYAGDSTAFVTAVYNSVLNRPPLAAGLEYWVSAIDNGTLTRGNAALSIMAGALANTSTQGLIDATAVTNKVTVGSNFTSAITTAGQIDSYKGQAAAATARALLATVNDATDTAAFQPSIAAKLDVLINISQVTARYGELNAIMESTGSAEAKLGELKAYCSIDFSLHGKTCEAGFNEIMLQGPLPLVQVGAYDVNAIDQIDSSVSPTDQNVATLSHNKEYLSIWLWKKASDGKFYLAGDGDKKAFIGIVPTVVDWGAPIRPYISIEIRVNDDGSGNPIADTAIVTGPGLSAPIAIQATKNTMAGVWTNATDPWWSLASTIQNSDTVAVWGPSPPPLYDLAAVRKGVAAGTPYVVNLMKSGQTIATYKQSLRVAPYLSDYKETDLSMWPDHLNFTSTSTSLNGSILTMENGSTASFPKIKAAPTLAFANGGTYATSFILPAGHELTSTAIYTRTLSNSFEIFDAIWAQAARSITIPSRPDYQANQVCADVVTVDEYGHRFIAERCAL